MGLGLYCSLLTPQVRALLQYSENELLYGTTLKSCGPGEDRMDPAPWAAAPAAGTSSQPSSPADGPAPAQPSKACCGSQLRQEKD